MTRKGLLLPMSFVLLLAGNAAGAQTASHEQSTFEVTVNVLMATLAKSEKMPGAAVIKPPASIRERINESFALAASENDRWCALGQSVSSGCDYNKASYRKLEPEHEPDQTIKK